MDNSAKYLIHAAFAADGVVERSDVVGAVYGQTEGLLGEELDIRRLQESSKLGRIDVEVQTTGGQSAGEITIATSLDRVETATLAAALETIDRVGPCRATIEATNLEDVRAATRREVVDRAQELLLSEFEGATSDAIVEEVRRRVATADVTTYEGLPAGPSVEDGDAVVVVEGRADVKALLAAGVKNAIAVEGTDVPEAVAELTRDRRTTAFFDGDRGGELVLEELRQVGEVDAVAFAPTDRSVEDLSRSEVLAALRSTVDVGAHGEAASAGDLADAARARTSGGTAVEAPDAGDRTDDEPGAGGAPAATDGDVAESANDVAGAGGGAAESNGGTRDGTGGRASAAEIDAVEREGTDAAPTGDSDAVPAGDSDVVPAGDATGGGSPTDDGGSGKTDGKSGNGQGGDRGGDGQRGDHDGNGEIDGDDAGATDEPDDAADEVSEADDGAADGATDAASGVQSVPRTIRDHVEALEASGDARFLDSDAAELSTVDASEAFDALDAAEPVPTVIVLDATLDQRLLDLAAQCGVREVVAAELGEFAKRPTDVRIRTATTLFEERAATE